VRYYTLALLAYDLFQIQWLARVRPAVTDPMLYVMHHMDPIDRLSGAVLLWSVEIIMQLRIYAIYERSCTVARVNVALFVASIAGFIYVLVTNVLLRENAIQHVLLLPLPGCPAIQTKTEWAQWIPATIFEGIMFGFVLFRSFRLSFRNLRLGRGVSLYEVVIKDQIRYWVGYVLPPHVHLTSGFIDPLASAFCSFSATSWWSCVSFAYVVSSPLP
ncbi:hypothetical protein BD626DRAFT_416965, partial [Schizophyllum amplum]